jgi:Ca-activated chloride channel family protein
MPTQARTRRPHQGNTPEHSIRDTLEQDAWRHHAEFAARLARRRAPHTLQRRSLRWHDRVLIIAAIVLLGLVLARSESARAQEHWGLEFQSASGQWHALALETRIRVDVTGLLARVEVTQVFDNSGTAWAEGIYRFPLPDGAAVDRMSVQVGDRLIEGEIQQREEARRVYQLARAAGQTAALVEQQRPNQYQSRLANIGPGERIQVRIGYLVNVHLDEDSFKLRLPMTFTPRWLPEAPSHLDPVAPEPLWATNGGGVHIPLELTIVLRTGISYAVIESRFHDVDIQAVRDGYLVELLPGADLPDRDFELAWTPNLAATPQAELLTWDGGDAIYAQLLVVPPLADALGPRDREVVFIIDTSGSMEGASLQQASAALVRGLEQLEPADHFNLIRFDSDTEVLFEASVPATWQNRQQAQAYISSLAADGGTVMGPALKAAFALPAQAGLLRQVIFITDGSVANERELLAQVAERLGDARVFTVSIGSAPNSWFMRKTAEIGRGSHTRIGHLDEVEARMTKLWAHLRHPALSDICFDWGTEAEYYPEIIPDLYAGQPLWLTARLPLEPRGLLLCGEFNGRPWEHQVSAWPGAGADTLATLWARKKIEALEDSIMFGADPEAIRAEVTDIALAHGLLTRYTSLVAVDRTPARRPDEPLNTEHVPSLLPAGSTLATAGFPPTGTGWLSQALLSCLTLLVATGMLLLSGARRPLGSSRTASARSPR